jgi:polyisoprenoid-binding protein YceI
VYPTLLVFLSIVLALVAGPQDLAQTIDTQRSSITIHVGKAGVFSAAAHEHWVNAAIVSGTIDTSGAMPSVRFTVDARKLSVKPETGVSDKDQADVQANMQTKVLQSPAYPEIVFQSTQVRRDRDNAWKVSGDLTLRGVTKSLTLDVARENDAYVGTARIKQTDFGIQPIKIGGGVVKVKDELEITFRVYALAR